MTIISIHAPRVGSDIVARKGFILGEKIFQSTLPAWGATLRGFCFKSRMADFNPRSPRGERPTRYQSQMMALAISIHAPRVGSDCLAARALGRLAHISIHAPRVGSDALFPAVKT